MTGLQDDHQKSLIEHEDSQMNVLKQVLANVVYRFGKRACGLAKTYLQRVKPYDEEAFWDDDFYDSIASDRDTISKSVTNLSSTYHYSSLEAALVLALSRRGKNTARSFLDIGSGSGHWIDFFGQLFPELDRVDACDVSAKSCEYLRRRFQDDQRVSVHHCSISQLQPADTYDLVCLLGCAFHIVRDTQLSELLNRISGCLAPDGVVILNDLLPWVSHANQFSHGGRLYNKFVRSRRRWKRLARHAGLATSFVTNHAWVRAPGRIPEGHIVCLTRSASAAPATVEDRAQAA